MKKEKLRPINSEILSGLSEGDKIARYGLFSSLTFVSREKNHVTLKDKNGNEKRVYESLFLKHGFIVEDKA